MDIILKAQVNHVKNVLKDVKLAQMKMDVLLV
jgi:hypothetical protein